jgi:hypothetical protein
MYLHSARVRYDWDEHNRGHVAAHQVEPPEVEEVLWQTTRSASRRAWTPRGKLRRPVTAFDANRKTRAAYRRRRNEEEQQD